MIRIDTQQKLAAFGAFMFILGMVWAKVIGL